LELTTEQAAETLNCSQYTVVRFARLGVLPYRKDKSHLKKGGVAFFYKDSDIEQLRANWHRRKRHTDTGSCYDKPQPPRYYDCTHYSDCLNIYAYQRKSVWSCTGCREYKKIIF
jgi:hypothetical protein